MKYEDAKKLKVGDKVAVLGVVTKIDGTDETQTLQTTMTNGELNWFYNKNILGKASDFNKTEYPVIFNEDEKEEFDYLRENDTTIFEFFDDVNASATPALYARLFTVPIDEVRKNQSEFVKAIEHPELIKVKKPEKYVIKVLGGYVHFNKYKIEIVQSTNFATKLSSKQIEHLKSEGTLSNVNLDSAKVKVDY